VNVTECRQGAADERVSASSPPIACVSDRGRPPLPRSANATPARFVPRRVLLRMIRDGDDGEPEALRLEHDGGTRRLAIRAGAHGRDPRGLQVEEGVDERSRSEVECVKGRSRACRTRSAG
jgi:hypothetical protein